MFWNTERSAAFALVNDGRPGTGPNRALTYIYSSRLMREVPK